MSIKREDTFSTLSLQPKSFKFISVEKYQTSTFPHTKNQTTKLHLQNENKDPEILLRKVRYQQTHFSSRQPRQAVREAGVIFYCRHRVSLLPGRSKELMGPGQPQEGQRSGVPDHPAKSPLLFQLCCNLPHSYLPKRWKKSLVQPPPAWLDSQEVERWIYSFVLSGDASSVPRTRESPIRAWRATRT